MQRPRRSGWMELIIANHIVDGDIRDVVVQCSASLIPYWQFPEDRALILEGLRVCQSHDLKTCRFHSCEW